LCNLLILSASEDHGVTNIRTYDPRKQLELFAPPQLQQTIVKPF